MSCSPKSLKWNRYSALQSGWLAGYGDLTYIVEETLGRYRLSVQYGIGDPGYLGWFNSLDEAKRRAQFDFDRQFEEMRDDQS